MYPESGIMGILQKTRVLQSVRRFFDSLDFIEVDTGILQAAVVPELHVPNFHLPCCDRYLLPSPELAMKRLLCQWDSEGEAHSIYQLAHCFRQEQQQDALHSWEFLMLEFYGLGYSTAQLLTVINELLQKLAAELHLPHVSGAKPVVLSFDELCRRALGLEFDRYWQAGLPGMRQLYAKAGGAVPELALDDLFHLFLIEFLEPYIARALPYCALGPYPDVTPLPAKCLDEGWVDRWELYVNGAELANACCEENRPEYLQRYRARFIQSLAQTSKTVRFDLAALELWQKLPIVAERPWASTGS